MKPPRDDGTSAGSAWMKGMAGGPDSLFWLLRARQLAPDDPRVALSLAEHQISNGQVAQARDMLTALAARHDAPAILTAQALAAQIAGEQGEGAAILDRLLRTHCLPADPAFPAFALHVAASAGYGGFTGVTAAGETLRQGKGRLLGAKPDKAALSRVEGLAEWANGVLRGWASRPAAPDTPPILTLTDAMGQTRRVPCGKALPPDGAAPFLPRYGFRVPPAALRGLAPPFRLHGPDGRDLMGSPLDPRQLAAKPIQAKRRGKPPGRVPRRAALAIVMPVYRGLAETKVALKAAIEAAPGGTRIIVVDDATPEPALAKWLGMLAVEKRITLARHETNQGFCAAVNTGIALAKGRDVLLLNSDTIIPRGAIETLRAAAYGKADTGTVTPFSNEATICSYPDPKGGNDMPDARGTARLNALAAAANGAAIVEIPTAIGFCMYVRHDCLAATGGFRGGIFAQGYGEENDFCLRARHAGYRHVLAAGAYVAHKGGVSFRAAAKGLMERNLAILNRLYPGYHEMILAHQAADPALPFRASLDAARLRAARKRKGAVLLITHSHGGGVARRVEAEMQALRAQGFQPLLLRTQFPAAPKTTPYPWPALLCGDASTASSLAFTLPRGMGGLLELLRELNVKRVVMHHMLGQHEGLRGLAKTLDVPQDIVIHDYASFCPRVNLLRKPAAAAPVYCGEPDVKSCVKCCATRKKGIFEPLPVPELLARSAAEFAAARAIIAPSQDTARRIARHFPGVTPKTEAWEDDGAPVTLRRPGTGPVRRVAVIGGIGPQKGYDVLLDCALDAAARNLPLEFHVIGASADDAKLLRAGIHVTGYYREGEAQALIEAVRPDLAFLPSIWPETWCFALTEAWRAGLHAIVFDLGAQGERVKATGRGTALPLGLPPARVNDFLVRVNF